MTAVATATLATAEIGPWLAKTYGAIARLLTEEQAGPAGPPFARYHMLADDRFTVEAGFPATRSIEAAGEAKPSALPGGQVAVTIHTGPYDAMQPAYQALISWVAGHNGEVEGDPWEVYFSDPATQPDPATWRTEIAQPYRAA